ncbi:hypothetical protein FOL47_009261 [Perkinsus chesapeaki]|uniref:Uncharacterized protein n=1 Tax=Perkinsus chesapeaki TaxID=330153 RepID=A0A7J6L9Q9_PERCH|nr:hypothetical protein FOL47_009261 [Perkinsus chesapeaki]
MTQPQESTSAATTRATSVEDQTGNNNHTTGKRLKNKIVSLINGTDYLVEFPLWLYVALMMSIAIIGAAGVNALFAYITYPPETAAVTDVWVWPNSICFDLVITAGLSFRITWLLSPTMAMRDIIVRSPLAIDPTTFPRVTRKLPCAKWLAHNPVFCTDPQNPISKDFQRQSQHLSRAPEYQISEISVLTRRDADGKYTVMVTFKNLPGTLLLVNRCSRPDAVLCDVSPELRVQSEVDQKQLRMPNYEARTTIRR